MAVLVTAIYRFFEAALKNMDHRDEPGDDEERP
jgi:hypothetical protein